MSSRTLWGRFLRAVGRRKVPEPSQDSGPSPQFIVGYHASAAIAHLKTAMDYSDRMDQRETLKRLIDQTRDYVTPEYEVAIAKRER